MVNNRVIFLWWPSSPCWTREYTFFWRWRWRLWRDGWPLCGRAGSGGDSLWGWGRCRNWTFTRWSLVRGFLYRVLGQRALDWFQKDYTTGVLLVLSFFFFLSLKLFFKTADISCMHINNSYFSRTKQHLVILSLSWVDKMYNVFIYTLCCVRG